MMEDSYSSPNPRRHPKGYVKAYLFCNNDAIAILSGSHVCNNCLTFAKVRPVSMRSSTINTRLPFRQPKSSLDILT